MTRIILPECRLSYPALLEARAMTDAQGNAQGKATFSAAFVFDPTADLSTVRQAIAAVVVEKFGIEKAKELLPKMVPGGSLKNPLRADIDKKYGDGSHFFVNARNATAPQCVWNVRDPMTGKAKIMTKAEIAEKMYAGAVVRPSVSPYWFDKAGNKGVGFALNNILWIRDGDRLDNRVSGEDEFADMVADAPVSAGSSAADLTAFLGG